MGRGCNREKQSNSSNDALRLLAHTDRLAMKSIFPAIFISLAVIVAGLPSGASAADNSMLRVTCDGDAAGAEVSINGKFKGECPIDIQVPAGNVKLTVRKKIDAERERVFEQEMQIGDGVVKKIEVALGGARMSTEALIKLNKAQGIEPGKIFRDCAECPEMVALPPGEFMMGSPESDPGRYTAESPQHKVNLAYPLAVGKFAVTFAEWDACVAARGCSHTPRDEGWGRGRRPVINVSWNDVQEYVSWLARTSGKPYRLLSEAEWEYAARAGTTTPFYTGQCISTEQANYDGTVGYNYNNCGAKTGLYRQKTVEVGSFKPNRFGLFDMAGNVYQWTQDCMHDNYSGAPSNGSAWIGGDCGSRVLRGGSWRYTPLYLRAVYRYSNAPVNRHNDNGFRVAR
jgi:formylglycine-generating enzyme required for sulfatase activity